VIVSTTSGEVRGEVVEGVTRFLSIPYAAAPVGELRFAPPVPAPAWDGVRDGTEPGPNAPQTNRNVAGFDLGPLVGPGWRKGPDYLTVDVYTPDTAAAGLPVLVFIHGGGFLAGTGSAAVYDGSAFTREGAVLVTLNYRVGIEGFLPLEGGATNLGLRDQIAALGWVRDNVAAFGGDPGNVTVFGQSAGAMSVACLLASPLAEGLFRRGIVQSGHAEMVRPLEQARKLADHLAKALDVPATAEAFRSIPAEDLLAAQEALTVPGGSPDLRDADGFDPGFGLSTFMPLFGDDMLPEHPGRAIESGAGEGVDLIVGSCRDEMALYLVPTGAIDVLTDEQLVAMMSKSHPDPLPTLERHGLGQNGRSAGEVAVPALTELVFRAPARRLAEAHQGRTYCYEFDWRGPLFDGRLGACHGIDLPFVFNNLDVASGLVGESAPKGVAELLNQSWVRFAATGDPGWPEYDGGRAVLHVNSASEVRPD
jgi:para-nitrobenzyl esterase